MADGPERRRLRVMPEVLPAPPPRDAAEGSPRARTLEHMHRLLAGATATAALVGCSSDEPSARPEPSATAAGTSTTVPSGTAVASATASPTATSSAEASASSSASPSTTSSAGGSGFAGGSATLPIKKPPPPPPHPTGYMVVDPMPSPARRP